MRVRSPRLQHSDGDQDGDGLQRRNALVYLSQMPGIQPSVLSEMADMAKEMSKLKGVPVSEIIRMGSTADGSPLPASSDAPLPASNAPTAGSLAN